MMPRTKHAILTSFLVVLSACGGSGSTGLITAENTLLAEVRETRECRDANGTTYCFAAVLPESEGAPPSIPSPEPSIPIGFDTSDIDPGTSCAVATREARGAWVVGDLRRTGDEATFDIVPTFDVGGDGIEAALLCFVPSPTGLPETTETLADLGPTIVYVAPVL